jgi:MFS transporter, OPA family, glycerol-3-phosphate transporter
MTHILNKTKTIKKYCISLLLFCFSLLITMTALAADVVDVAVVAEKPWYTGFAPILILLVVIGFVIWRLPTVKEEFPGQLKHLESKSFRRRRSLNWLLLGCIYAFLYWGRYNLNGAISALGGKEMVATFNWIFAAGTITYGISFLINGPLTDRYGGRFSILIGAIGAATANILMGVACYMKLNGSMTDDHLFWSLILLYPLNMYFQSFGAVAIVKCNASWFHVRERGVFGAIFGILISLGIYFAFDFTSMILIGFKMPVHFAFFIPAAALLIAFVFGFIFIRNKPSHAGYDDVLTGDASCGESDRPDPPMGVFKMMLGSSVIMTIAVIEFCSGFLRQAIMQIGPFFAISVGTNDMFVFQNWGMMLCCAGILGGVFAGTISDHVFNSRRGPVAGVLYAGMLVSSIVMCFLLGSPVIGWLVLFMSMCVIGVHGMLSGTASMDFGGTKNVGIAVGIIDGFVYLGTATQAVLYRFLLPEGGADAAVLSNWNMWPVVMVPVALIGLIFAYRIRNAKPKQKKA